MLLHIHIGNTERKSKDPFKKASGWLQIVLLLVIYKKKMKMEMANKKKTCSSGIMRDHLLVHLISLMHPETFDQKQ